MQSYTCLGFVRLQNQRTTLPVSKLTESTATHFASTLHGPRGYCLRFSPRLPRLLQSTLALRQLPRNSRPSTLFPTIVSERCTRHVQFHSRHDTAKRRRSPAPGELEMLHPRARETGRALRRSGRLGADSDSKHCRVGELFQGPNNNRINLGYSGSREDGSERQSDGVQLPFSSAIDLPPSWPRDCRDLPTNNLPQ